MYSDKLTGPIEISGIVFCGSVFLGILSSNGEIIKFTKIEGTSLVSDVTACAIGVLEWAVKLRKVEPKTFAQLRRHLLRLHKMGKAPIFYQNTKKAQIFLNEVMNLVDQYWDRLISRG